MFTSRPKTPNSLRVLFELLWRREDNSSAFVFAFGRLVTSKAIWVCTPDL